MEDDGAGLGLDGGDGGHGLENMARRAQRWGGAFGRSGNAWGGTTVTWQVPQLAR